MHSFLVMLEHFRLPLWLFKTSIKKCFVKSHYSDRNSLVVPPLIFQENFITFLLFSRFVFFVLQHFQTRIFLTNIISRFHSLIIVHM